MQSIVQAITVFANQWYKIYGSDYSKFCAFFRVHTLLESINVLQVFKEKDEDQLCKEIKHIISGIQIDNLKELITDATMGISFACSLGVLQDYVNSHKGVVENARTVDLRILR